jgi:LmbE family N-acetylglucosaminyl deacetylase
MSGTVVHLSPHPDDELLGAPATLMALRDYGWTVLNVACGLGEAGQHQRRQAELREACRLAGFDLMVLEENEIWATPPSRGIPRKLTGQVIRLLEEIEPAIVVSPTPHDRHPAHELVGRVAASALAAVGDPVPRWWMWGLWGQLPYPSLLTSFDEVRCDEILCALAAHAGELDRNDYRVLVRSRGELVGCIGPELVLGFGTAGAGGYAEMLTEAVRVEDRWVLGQPQQLDSCWSQQEPSGRDLSPWISAPSFSDLVPS